MSVEQSAVVVSGLRKRFGDVVAIDGVDFTVAHGECFGFLGPNGAGKTTLLKTIYGLATVEEGTVHVLGRDVARERRDVKALVGVVPQDDNLDGDMTLRESLLIHANYYGIPRRAALARLERLLELAGLSDRRDAMPSELSGGMRRRLLIVRALVGDPRLVVLDEPTTGLDPAARRTVWNMLRALRDDGITLLLTTHYMEEAQQLCDRLAVMDRGRIADLGTPDGLIGRHEQVDLEGVFLHLTGHELVA